MGYNCCFFLNFVPLYIESPYNFGGTGPIFGVKNPLQRVHGHAAHVIETLNEVLNLKFMILIIAEFIYQDSIIIDKIIFLCIFSPQNEN
jgi:hypothetical protein